MMTSNRAEQATGKKVIRLPKPDAENITVLTRELPNAPILPWQHYDSPWIKDGDRPTSADVIHLRENPPASDDADVNETEVGTVGDDSVADANDDSQTSQLADEFSDEGGSEASNVNGLEGKTVEIDESCSTFSASSQPSLSVDDTSTAC